MRGLLLAAMASVLVFGCGGGAAPAGGGTGGAGVVNTGGMGTFVVPPGSGGAPALGGSTGSGANTIPAIIDQGPQSLDDINSLFVTVTVCTPGTTTCQTIDHVLVDTGSSGLRVLESVLTLSLPSVDDGAGSPMGACTQFVDGTMWGPILSADVKLGGESAAAIPIQAIGKNTYPMPTTGTCASGQPITDLQALGGNGLIGVGIDQQDCGPACARTTRNPGMYFACTSKVAGGCTPTVAPLGSQTSNPIVSFPIDNNGVIIHLPAVAAGGVTRAVGSLIFGIGTQANNGLGSATVLTPVDVYGNIGTAYPTGGAQYTGFIDSGTNTFAFLDAATSGVALCASSNLSSFYCPATPAHLTATVFGGNNLSTPVTFSVADPSMVSASIAALGTLGSEMPGFSPSMASSQPAFLWGLPFFYGRTVYTAIADQNTPAGAGPYVAF